MEALTSVIKKKTMKKEYYHPGVVMTGRSEASTGASPNQQSAKTEAQKSTPKGWILVRGRFLVKSCCGMLMF